MKLLSNRRNNHVALLLVTFAVFFTFYYSKSHKPSAVRIKSYFARIGLEVRKPINAGYSVGDVVIQPPVHLCNKNPSIQIVFLVISHVGNHNRRIKLRDSLSPTLLAHFNATRIFLVGRVPDGESRITQNEIEDEGDAYNDILQGNFTEHRTNLTSKHLLGLQWISDVCSQAAFLIKTDDNYDFSVQALSRIVHRLWTNQVDKEEFMMGFINDVPEQYKTSLTKWYKARDRKQNGDLPPYVAGYLYITTPKVAAMLTKEAMYQPYFSKDDIFITGVLTHALKIRLLQIPHYL